MNPISIHKSSPKNAAATGTAGFQPAPQTSRQDVGAPNRCRVITHAALFLAALAFATSCSRHDDHAGHDHTAHDHAGHSHAGHDHATHSSSAKKDAHADHNHDHAKHDHHDHAAHDHDHKPAPAKKHDPHAGHSHGASESTNVTYDEKTGLKFDHATAHAINLTTARIATRPLAHRVLLNATVIDAGPPVQITALVPPAVAADMEDHPHDGVRLLAVNRALTHATGQVEVTLAVANVAQTAKSASSPGTDIGDSLAIPLIGPPEQKLTIPNAAVLRTIEGTFAYLHHDGRYRRTPVALGMTDGTHTEILSGLASDDLVAATAVEQLWLTELRLTKGGGHSH